MAIFDPFAYLDKVEDAEEVAIVDEEMITVEVGGKILGIDEGLFMGIIIGFVLSQFVGEYW